MMASSSSRMSLASSRAIALVLSSTRSAASGAVTSLPRLVLPSDDGGAHFVEVEMYLLRSPQRPSLRGPQHPRVAPDQGPGVLHRLETSVRCCTRDASTMALVKASAMIRSPMAWGIGPAMADAEQRGGLFIRSCGAPSAYASASSCCPMDSCAGWRTACPPGPVDALPARPAQAVGHVASWVLAVRVVGQA